MMAYATVESLLDEAATNLRRYSRGSTSGHKTISSMGGSMRIVKPNSTSNSPRLSANLGRRKTVMSDRSRMQVSGTFVSHDGLRNPTKSNRPVSWHPSSQFAPQQVYQTTYQATDTSNDFPLFDLPHATAVYSGYASPDSTFSPVTMPYTGYEQQHYPYTESTSYPPSSNYGDYQQQMGVQHVPSYLSTPAENSDSTMYSHFDWSNFSINGFERSTTAPPTPENFLPIQHPDPSFPSEEAIPYHPLSDPADEEEGEILCGMGLYDEPDTGKMYSSDPQLDNYRSSVSQLLGAPRKEAMGKGLKLEETWAPPADDEEEDEDEDGDGEDDDEVVVERVEYNPDTKNATVVTTQRVETDFAARNRDRISWL
jgi:hypothetical protein